MIRNSFTEAIVYKKWMPNVDKNSRKVPPTLYDLRMQTLVDILNGDVLVHCHSYRKLMRSICFMKVFSDFNIQQSLSNMLMKLIR